MRKNKDNSMKNKVTDKLNIIPLKSVGACEGHLWGVMRGLRKSNLGE
jgi:uncharacterized membrane protein